MTTTLTRRPLRNRMGLPSIFSVDPFGSLRDEFDHLLSRWFQETDAARCRRSRRRSICTRRTRTTK